VIYIHGGKKNIRPQHLENAKSVEEIITQNFNAWLTYDTIFGAAEAIAANLQNPLVVMCCGPTATVLANDFQAVGIQAFDAGHAGRFMRIFDEGENVNKGKHG
jgi:hypothetical protein